MNVFYDENKVLYTCPSSSTTCEQGQFFNYLACMCLYEEQCDIACPDGEDLLPNEQCTCAPVKEIKNLFPKWVSKDDVLRSYSEGIQAAQIAEFEKNEGTSLLPLTPPEPIEPEVKPVDPVDPEDPYDEWDYDSETVNTDEESSDENEDESDKLGRVKDVVEKLEQTFNEFFGVDSSLSLTYGFATLTAITFLAI